MCSRKHTNTVFMSQKEDCQQMDISTHTCRIIDSPMIHYLCVCISCGCLFFCLVTALDIPYRQPCLHYVLAHWPCFCLLETYNRSQNLKQWGEPVVWTMNDLFLWWFTKRAINTDKSSGEREAIPPCLN